MGQSKPPRPTAIVVEDDDIQRDMIALMLEEGNFDVIQCEDGETAALALKARHASVLITDVKLTGRMTGVELARFARQRAPEMRVFVISGTPPADALPEGVTFFAKPVYPLALMIRQAMRADAVWHAR